MRIPEGALPGPARLRVEMESSTGRLGIPVEFPVILIPEGFRALPLMEEKDEEAEKAKKE